jgi:hypothetical protein
VFEHQAAFTEMLRVGRDMRKRMFDTLEERHAQDFENGKAGRKLYEDLLSAVRDAGVPEAVTEFESRFLPLLNRDRPQGDEESDFSGGVTDRDRMLAAEDRRGGGWVWIWSLAVAAVITGALFFGYSFLKVTASKPPAMTETGVPATNPTEPVSQPPAATGAPVPAEQPTEPASQSTIKPPLSAPIQPEPPADR